jgi:protein gp37
MEKLFNIQRHVAEFRAHPENLKIYGDTIDFEFLESIKKKGILTPLLISQDNQIISGHRRWRAAQELGFITIPITVFQSTDPLDILEALVESNKQRVKTNEQIGREYDALEEVEKARAKQRQAEQAKVNQPQAKKSQNREAVPTSDAGRARDTVGQKIGVSGRTAQQAAVCVRVMDGLEQLDKTTEAHQIRQLLKKNIGKAYIVAKGLEALMKPPADTRLVTKHKPTKYLTVEFWQSLSVTQQREVIESAPRKNKEGWNEQKTDNIEWAKWSWNPITGCLHNCPYCYARDIAEQLYPQKFAPAFIPDRLHTPRNMKVPEIAQQEIGFKNVFTCSMADLFGKWVPTEWIEAVLSVVRDCPQWNFLFLTKFPLRLAEFPFPDNAWVGTSVDCQARVANAEQAFRNVRATIKWLSCEPLLESLTFSDLSMFQWVVIGGASKSAETPEFRPPRSWVNDLWTQAKDAGCKIYEKTNLLERIKEYPGQRELKSAQEVTKQFHYPLLVKPERPAA